MEDMEEDHHQGGGVEGWPLGLLRMRLANAFSSALLPARPSFLLPTSTCSSRGSSDQDTESSLFSFQSRSITLGSFMGIRSGSEPDLMKALPPGSRSQAFDFASPPHPHYYHQTCQALNRCRKLIIRRQQLKRIAMDSAKLCNNFLIRCTACTPVQHKQTQCSSSHFQPNAQLGVVRVPSLAHLLKEERQ